MQTIVIVNEKGGVGKSTTAVSLAHGLAIRGKQTLLIDLDPQGQCATLIGVQQEPCIFDLLISELKPDQVLRNSGRGNLWIIPGNKRTATAQRVLIAEKKNISFLGEKLEPLRFDYIVLDTAPSLGELTGMALYSSDYFLIPTACDFLSSEGVFRILDTVKAIKKEYKRAAELLGVLPTFYDQVTKESAATLEDLEKHFKSKVLDPIHRATILRECAAFGKTIFEQDSKSRAAVEYTNLVNHVLEVIK